MSSRQTAAEESQPTDHGRLTLRIGEVAELTAVTTRTLRYWQEIGLLTPSDQRHTGERLYSDVEVKRALRIRELQELLGFSLAEIRAVLDTDDIVDKLRTAHLEDAHPDLQRSLLSEAMEANDGLLVRLDHSLSRIKLFRDERAAKAKRMRARAEELDTQITSSVRKRP